MLMSTLMIVLVLILQRPGATPDAVVKIPMDSIMACQAEAKEWLDIGLTKAESDAGFIAKGGACYTNYPEVEI